MNGIITVPTTRIEYLKLKRRIYEFPEDYGIDAAIEIEEHLQDKSLQPYSIGFLEKLRAEHFNF